MAFTMMATAGAAYTDQADIQATEAVEMLNAIGVMTGDPDGSFRPNDTITRAEACRMIYTIRTNSDDASAYADMQTTFKDVPADAWYAGYVKHCQAAGIVSGTKADGSAFEPSREVTGVELALMCLRVMGYDPAKADIGGSTWSTKTISIATEAGILKDVNTTITADCPRQWAAQIMYNTIDARTVRWSNDSETYTDEDMGGNPMDKVGKKYMGLYINIGTLSVVDGNSLQIIQSADDIEDSDNTRSQFTSVGTNYTSLLGQKVKVLFKDNKTNEVIGVYATGDNTSYTADMKDIEDDGNKVKFGGASYGFDENEIDAVLIDANNEEVTSIGTMSAADFDAYNDDATTDAAGTAKLITASVTFVDNDGDGKLNIAIITEYKTAKVTYVGSDRITAGTTYKMEDENIADDFAKDDYAVISYNPYDECLDIVKAEVVTDTLSGIKEETSYQQYQIGSTWYNISNTNANKVTRGDSVLAYVVAGVVVDIKSDDGAGAIPSNIAVVVGTGGTASVYGDQVRLRYFDGTNKIVTLSDQNATTPEEGAAYRVSGSDTSVRLENLELYSDNQKEYNGYQLVANDTAGTGGSAADPDNGTINGTAVADDAVIILYTAAGQSKQITGKQFKALSTSDIASNTTAAKAVFTKSVNGLNRVRLASVLVGNINITGASSDNYAYVTSNSFVNGNGDTVINIWDGAENKTVTMNGSDSFAKGTLIGYSTIDSEGVISDVTDFGTVEDATDSDSVGSFTANTLYVGGNAADDADDMIVIEGKQLNVTSDTHVLVVDSAASDEKNIGIVWDNTALPQGKENADGSFEYNAWFTTSTTGGDDTDLEVLVIDNTGVFDAFDEGDEEEGGGTVTGDYTTTYATVNVSDKELITGAQSALMGGDLTVQVDVPAYVAEATATTKITVDGVEVAATSGGDTLKAGKNDITLTGKNLTKDNVIVVEISDLEVTKYTASFDATAVTSDDYTVELSAALTELATAGAKVTFKITEKGEGVTADKKMKINYTLTNATEDGKTTGSVTTSDAFDDGTLDNEEKTVEVANNIVPTGDGAVIITVTGVEFVD